MIFSVKTSIASLLLIHGTFAATHYLSNAKAAVTTLQKWYNPSTGLWDTTGWWNSANCLTVLADFTALDPSQLSQSAAIFENTYTRAQGSTAARSLTISRRNQAHARSTPRITRRAYPRFINDYYDDEAWWALAWIQAYDLTQDVKYLNTAADLFADMTTGWNATCGGLWWDKPHTQIGAIENELFLSLAAHLARRLPSQAGYYKDWASTIWSWFSHSGLINDRHTINNGLDLGTCKNDGGTVWSYNQGVILGALVEMSQLFGDLSYVSTAQEIASAAMSALSNSDGVLTESCEPNCTGDAPQFKGVFMRNLKTLYKASSNEQIRRFLLRNADSIWEKDRGDDYQLGPVWSGPFSRADASTQSSACDALVAAAALRIERICILWSYQSVQLSPKILIEMVSKRMPDRQLWGILVFLTIFWDLLHKNTGIGTGYVCRSGPDGNWNGSSFATRSGDKTHRICDEP
ncbi:glycoside hydrolase family 76 protein [Aspergillus homomorphus CBS 101889]|uniref:Six-hairpin glycosidase n=1 Tax=Aspergillus homomorphus (strain CBS 101889) TaxID=1450537 RepID=A0A395I6G7_ASPHC|nr:Six-hairpin glycosidase [Aspergillus homomorphus CBS 101889]RAL14768.1 Six-hairpin glycosidase [Aspergillus homomorphus CBS 101889]